MYLVIASYLPSANSFAQFVLSTVNATTTTGEKPQSKVWYYGGHWWTVIPVSSGPSGAAGTAGTYLYRLDGSTWEQLDLKLTSSTNVKADTKMVGDITHIAIFQESQERVRLVSIQFVAGTPSSYELWSGRVPNLVDITLETGTETAVIDLDSGGKMWLAYAANTEIYVRWSTSPYDTWNTKNRYQLNTANVKNDDICSVTAFGGDKIGVLWSNQNDYNFYFKYHSDSQSDPEIWSDIETASPGVTGDFSDNHINFAVDSDGTIYAAVKTSYSHSSSNLTIGLLQRTTGGSWYLYDVTKSDATRPIVLLDDTYHKIFVVYTSSYTSAANINYKWSTTTSTISFSAASTLAAGLYNNPTSIKETFINEVTILYSTTGNIWNGIIPGSPFPVELAFFSGILNGNKVELRWRTETEVNNYGFDIERTTDNSNWIAIGFAEGHGNSNSPKQYNFSDADINQSGTYNYRLKQIDNDGTYEYSDVVSVEVGVPNNFYLSQNYPNPFNPETRIDFTLPEKQFVTIRVYNTLGEQVAELVNEERDAGSYSVLFDASNLPSGVYIYRLQTSSFAANKKMTFLK